MYIRIFLFLSLIAASFNAYSAGCASNGCTGTPSELFTNFYVTGHTDGRVFLHLKENVAKQNLDCSLAEGAYMSVLATHPLFKEIYSSLLSASALNRKIYVRIINRSVGCEVAYIRFYM